MVELRYFNMAVRQGERNDVGRSRMPIAWMRRMNTPVVPENSIPLGWRGVAESEAIPDVMLAIVSLLGTYVANLFKSRRRLRSRDLFFVIS